jgi:hypothetical protein
MAIEAMSKNAPVYIPLAIGIKMLKDTVEEGKELPKSVQLINSVGAGMVAGIGLSTGLYGARFANAVIQEKHPYGTISQAVKEVIQHRGFKPKFSSVATEMFGRGAVLGCGYFAGEQIYKHFTKKD